MHGVFETLALNAASASLLGGLVWVAGRFVRRPGVMHALWIIVLLKLVTPPLVEVAALPRPGATDAGPALSAAVLPPDVLARIAAAPPPDPSLRDQALSAWATLADPLGFWIWSAGIVGLLLIGVLRAVRFRRLVAGSPIAPPAMRERAGRLARRIGVRRCPTVRLVDGRVPPMLWGGPGSCEILFPRALVDRLAPREQDALLTHELAHVRRRDHWVRYLELGTLAVFWWHPLVWWVRRNLRIAEEKSCDALVLRTLPDRSRDYARGLLKTLEFLAGRGAVVPQLATGAAETRHLKERLTMIVQDRAPGRLRPVHRLVLAVLALSALVVFPTWFEPVTAANDGEDRQELLNIRRHVLELESQLRDLRLREAELQHALEAARFREELDSQRAHAEALRARGEVEAATRMQRELEQAQRRHELDQERAEADLRLMHGAGGIELELQQAMLEAEKAQAQGDEARAKENHERARELERRLRELHMQAEAMHLRARDEELARATADLQRAIEEARERGDEDIARSIERELKRLLDRDDILRTERHDEVAELHDESRRLTKLLAESERHGNREEADRLRGELQEIKSMLHERALREDLERKERLLEEQRMLEEKTRRELEEGQAR